MIPYEDENGAIKDISLIVFMKTTLEDVTKRELNPIYFLDGRLKWYSLNAFDRRMVRNTGSLRKVLKKIIADRRDGKSKAYREGAADLLSILLGNDLYKDDDDMIIDEIMMLFLAGSKTVQLTTANMFCYLE